MPVILQFLSIYSVSHCNSAGCFQLESNPWIG
uniref:Uncharacterized protein n=1 Tax=Rhizophora mucronata TaxID=61149 RepID=A0A2P2KDM0_RHIMU